MKRTLDVKKSIEFAFYHPKGRQYLFAYLGYNLIFLAIAIIGVAISLLSPEIAFVYFILAYFVLIISSYLVSFYSLAISYEIVESVVLNKELTPIFEDFKGKFFEGLKIFAIRLVWGIPLSIITYIITFAAMFVGFIIFILVVGLVVNETLMISLLVLIGFIFYIALLSVAQFIALATMEPVMFEYIKSGRDFGSITKFELIWTSIKKMYKTFLEMTWIILVARTLDIIINIPFIIFFVFAVNQNDAILGVISFVLLVVVNIPITIFNIAFGNISIPHLLGQTFKKYFNE